MESYESDHYSLKMRTFYMKIPVLFLSLCM